MEDDGTELGELPGGPAPAESTPGSGQAENGLGDRLDRTGQPLGEPVRVEDETVTDVGSELTPTPDTAPVPPADDQPLFEDVDLPAEPEVMTPPEVAVTPVPGQPLGAARATEGGLNYYFTLLPVDGAYEFQLEISNPTLQPVVLNYSTGAKFDFIAKSGTDVLWYYNWNRFFMQTSETQTLAPGEVVSFRGEWDGLTKEDEPLPPGALRFEAVHQLVGQAVRLLFDAGLGQ